jgi:hypothetical protein
MKKMIVGGVAAGAVALGLAGPATAHASESFIICPDGNTGVATSVTSCEFARSMRWAYFHQPGPVVIAYSPVMDQVYNMQCQAGLTAYFNNGAVVNSARCVVVTTLVVVW